MRFFSKRQEVTVEANGQALVVTMPAATGKGRRVWRASLDRFATVAVDVRENRGRFAVMMTTPEGESEIASFALRKQADELMARILCVLAPKGSKTSWGRRVLKIVVGLVVVYFLLSLFGGGGDQRPSPRDAGIRAPVQSGVPVPAEDLFK